MGCRDVGRDERSTSAKGLRLFSRICERSTDTGGCRSFRACGKSFVISGGSELFFKDVFLPLAKSYVLVRSNGSRTFCRAEMQQTLTYLNRLPEADWAPAAIFALKDWKRDPNRAAFLLREIERLAMLTRLLCAGSGKRVRRFAELIKGNSRGRSDRQSSHPALQLSRDEVRGIAFHLKDFHKRNPKVCKLLLLRLGDEMSGGMDAVDPDLYTIEHVLPQRPSASSPWRQLFASAEERAQLVESLGNLVLITQQENDRARNASWDERTADLCEVVQPVADAFDYARRLDEPEWRKEQIEARELRLVGLIDRMWRVDLLAQRPGARAAVTKPAGSDEAARGDAPTRVKSVTSKQSQVRPREPWRSARAFRECHRAPRTCQDGARVPDRAGFRRSPGTNRA